MTENEYQQSDTGMKSFYYQHSEVFIDSVKQSLQLSSKESRSLKDMYKLHLMSGKSQVLVFTTVSLLLFPPSYSEAPPLDLNSFYKQSL